MVIGQAQTEARPQSRVRVERIEYSLAPYLAGAGWSEVIREAGAGGHCGITAEGSGKFAIRLHRF